jgi:hypothetical protein
MIGVWKRIPLKAFTKTWDMKKFWTEKCVLMEAVNVRVAGNSIPTTKPDYAVTVATHLNRTVYDSSNNLMK